jgi:hypothetical protein
LETKNSTRLIDMLIFVIEYLIFYLHHAGADHTYQIVVGHVYHIFYEGCLTNFEIADDEEASLLYPEVQYTLMDKYMERYL